MTLGLLLAFGLALGWIPLYVFRTEAMQAALRHYSGDERRSILWSPVVVAVHVTLACILVSRSDPPLWRAIAGAGLFLAAVTFWFWARLQISPLRTKRLPDQPPIRVRCDGAFGIVRNPLYFGYLLAAAAPALVAARPVLLVTFAACCVALTIRAAQDERRLHAQLGPIYAEYCRSVKRLIPFVW